MSIDIDKKRSYYDEFWKNRAPLANAHELLRLGQIFQQLSVVRAHRLGEVLEVCDLGCGTGWLANMLRILGNVTGVELSDAGVEAAKVRYPGIDFTAADLLTWRPDKTFDVVVSSEVIEHLTEKKAFVETIDTILRPGGWVVLTTPNRDVKAPWDASNQSGQILEDWINSNELQALFAKYEIVCHKTFMLDFSYRGKFRWLSAPKLLKLLDVTRLREFYDYLRGRANLGLYQILLCRKPIA